jgi:hypothetical protein
MHCVLAGATRHTPEAPALGLGLTRAGDVALAHTRSTWYGGAAPSVTWTTDVVADARAFTALHTDGGDPVRRVRRTYIPDNLAVIENIRDGRHESRCSRGVGAVDCCGTRTRDEWCSA